MSGPKSSRYTLTPEQRRILAEQRKIERRKAVAKEKIKKSQKRFLQISGTFENEKQIAAELLKRKCGDGGAGALFAELEELLSPVQPLAAVIKSDDVNALEGAADALSASLKKAEAVSEKISRISAKNEENLKADLRGTMAKGFDSSFADVKTLKEAKEEAASSLRKEARIRLAELAKNEFLSESLKSEIHGALTRLEEIADEVFLKNFISVSVSPVIKKSELFLKEYNECREEFESLYTEYTALCALYSVSAKEYECSRASVAAMREEIAEVKRSIAENDEQAYISECLDEVMEEMGYSVLGSREVTKRNGKKFRSELYSYGDGTAVNVTYSSDGKIAMELGGLDTDDRAPTARETEKLCSSMEEFCSDFKEIEKRLLHKGVVLADRISLLPPDAEYAQIINTSDYDMEKEAEKINVTEKRRTAAKQKALRKE